MNEIKKELHSLSPSAIVELFVLDATDVGGEVSRFHANTNELNQPVVWRGETYNPWPVEATGFELTVKGALPRPRIKIANINGLFSEEVSKHDDLVGAKVIRKRTMVKFLDAVNFKNGNPFADPNQQLPDELWFVEWKVSENRYMIEWELSSVFDMQGVMLPYRQAIRETCVWKYRSAECGYTGDRYFDNADLPCAKERDFCAKRLSSCRVRFGNNALPFGGFPGTSQYGS